MTGIRFEFHSHACGGPLRDLTAEEFVELLGRELAQTERRAIRRRGEQTRSENVDLATAGSAEPSPDPRARRSEDLAPIDTSPAETARSRDSVRPESALRHGPPTGPEFAPDRGLPGRGERPASGDF